MNFADALNVIVADIERPPLAPAGHYRWKITKSVLGAAGPNWDTLSFQAQAIAAEEDVDPVKLQAFGGLNSVRNRVQFMFSKGDDDEARAVNERTLWRVKQFLTEHCGIDGSGPLKQVINRAGNAEFLGNIRHRQDKENAETFYAEIDRTAPIT